MKRFGWLLAIFVTALPAWSAKTITVAELKDKLASMHQAGKSDDDVAAALKQVQLSEELSQATMNSFGDYVPGQATTEQLFVLVALSAALPPPASEIPSAATPDAAAQKAMLDKAEAYVKTTYDQLPAVTTSKATRRFQDNMDAAAPASGKHGPNDPVDPYRFVHFVGATSTDVASDHGIERAPSAKDKTPWGANRMIAIQEPDPSLNAVFQEATDSGTIKWLRWQTIEGKQFAVFGFEVPKKKSHLNVNICCFPNFVPQIGVARTTSDSLPQDDASWHNYKATVPYHGQFFIDPGTGAVVRMITEAELKHSEIVRQQDTRIDYGSVPVGDKTLILPVKSVVATEVVPNSDTTPGSTSARTTLFTAEYTNYQRAGGAK